MIRSFVHMLVILGLVFSTISPACAFMSGQAGVMEICGADGTIKTVSLPAEYDPFATVDEQAPARIQNPVPANARSVFIFLP
ncbi:MAG: hypothetical protein LRZ85_09675 [Alphaproteobacteria bacterium]|nr:hypothetical protein [Alphaproteobacteria bacterium]